MFADVILPLNMPQMLTYGVPAEMHENLKLGMRVEVALGKNKFYAAVVARLHENKPETYSVKPIRSIIDEVPVVNEIQLRFWDWISSYYLATPGEVMQAALPAHLKLVSETRLQWIADEGVVYEWSDAAYVASEALMLRKEMTISELQELVGLRSFASVLNELLENEVVRINDSLETAYRPKKEKTVRLSANYTEEKKLIELFKDLERAPRQLDLLMAYTEISIKQSIVRISELLERTGAKPVQIKALTDKGVFIIEEVDVDRVLLKSVKEIKEVEFSEIQQQAYNEIDNAFLAKKVVLLHGVTGSGKTLLYIKKIRECIASGKQAIMLIPEIGLTTHLVSRLHAYFGDTLGVYHSHFSNNERVEIWEKVRKGAYKVVVGPRSLLWLPYKNLGLLIVDEEHDGSYKQKDPSPRFHARDAAIFLATLYGSEAILGSATPSIESLYNVQNGKYAYIHIKERYLGAGMPVIEIINPKSLARMKVDGIRLVTPELQNAIEVTLIKKKQIILFQNRRGYAPFQICTSCGWVPQCKNCSVALTYHKNTDKMHCHYCGSKSVLKHSCPACGGITIVSKTFGTEKLEEEINVLFPKVRTARMDIDSMRGRNSMQDLLDKLAKGNVDILVGTQMVVKGLDFATVGLVGIISADSLLSFPDFRVNERAFQIMEQVSGRAGRFDGDGRVLIQAHNGTHPVLGWVKEHDVHAFYRHEIKYRLDFGYPPFTRLIKVIFKHQDEFKTIEAAGSFSKVLSAFLSAELLTNEVVFLGPAPAPIARIKDQYHHEIWIKCTKGQKVLEKVKDFLKAQRQMLNSQRGFTNVIILFDVDPV